tara:strand:- start:1401 stop:1601 length:201 start_codon:yes stop_codon:yes gene_type:complete
MKKETKVRTVIKSIVWRLIATLNSFIVLSVFPNYKAIFSAIIMNITGFFIYYIYERLCNKVSLGIK